MEKCALLALIATSLFLLSNCSKVQQAPEKEVVKSTYSNDFTTLEIRSLWHVCSLSFFERNPYTPKEVMVNHCDCYSDYMRKTYKDRAEINSFTKEKATELTKNLIIECNLKFHQDQTFINPT